MEKTISEVLEKYFNETPQEQLDKDWVELKHWNDIGPDVQEYIDICTKTTMKAIVNNSDKIFNKKINAEKAIYKILHSGEYGGLVTDEEWNDKSNAKFSFCNIGNKILIIPYINQRTTIAFHTIDECNDFITKNLELVNDYLMIS